MEFETVHIALVYEKHLPLNELMRLDELIRDDNLDGMINSYGITVICDCKLPPTLPHADKILDLAMAKGIDWVQFSDLGKRYNNLPLFEW